MDNLLLTFNDAFEKNWSNYIHHVKQEKTEMGSLAVNIDNLDKINIKSENSSDNYKIEYKYVDDIRDNRLNRNILNDVPKEEVNESELNKIDSIYIKKEKETCDTFSVKSKINSYNIKEESDLLLVKNKIKHEDSLEDTLNEMIDSLEQNAKQQCEMEKHYDKDKIDLDSRKSNIINISVTTEGKPKGSENNPEDMQIETEMPHHLNQVNDSQLQPSIQNKSTYNGKTFQCDICEKKSSNSRQLGKHKLNHTADLTCNLCQKSFPNNSNLVVHKKRHITCNLCQKSFSNSSNLVVHKRSHTGETPFKCSLCDKGFFLKNHLTTHKISHTGETPFKCSMCDKEFSCDIYLTTHKRIHAGDKKGHSIEVPVKCNMCDKGFSKSDHLSKPKRWRLFSKKE